MKTAIKILALSALIIFSSYSILFAETDADKPEPLPDFAGKVAVINIKGAIIVDNVAVKLILGGGDAVTDTQVAEMLKKAETDGARMVVLEIDSPGGIVTACDNICKKLLAMPKSIPTVALVTKQAISGGSMVATACREIVMVEGSTIGDCEPHALNAELPDYMREKVETTIRATMRANAQANNHPEKILEAMVTKRYKLFEVEFSDSKKEFIFSNELALLEEQIEKKADKRSIKGKKIIADEGELLTLTSKEAKEYGLANGVFPSADAFYTEREIEPANRVTANVALPPFKFEMSITVQMVLAVFLIIGIAGIVVETQVPGFGIPGVTGIIGFACFFSVLLFQGRADAFEIGLFVVGIILLLLEIFIIPGFGVAGIMGICCLLGSLVLSYLPPLSAGMDWRNELVNIVNIFGLSALLALVLGALLIKIAPEVPWIQHLFLKRTLKSGADILGEVQAMEEGLYPREEKKASEKLIGMHGTSLTVLRPAGKMRTDDGRVYDVVSSGMIIEKDCRVRITDKNGPRIEVEEIGES